MRWNPQVEPVAKEVEALRHLKFDHPVNVRFLTEAAFAKQQRADRSKLSASDQADLSRAQSQLRALGLIGQDVDLFDAANDISSTNVLAYYDPKTERVTVRGKGAIDVATRVTLAHELTHALQDQHFDLAKVRKAADTHHAQTTARAVIEGDTVRIQTLYRRKLSNADEQAYLDASRAHSDPGAGGRDGQGHPAISHALFDAPYAFGPALVQVAESKLGGGVDGLFRNVPTNDTAFLTPSTLVDGARFTTVGRPRTTRSEKVVGKPDVFGALALYLVLASRLGPSAALEVADGWGGDSMITLKRHGNTCLRAKFVGRDAERTARDRGALEDWSSAMPKGTATVDRGRSGVSLTACDTGATVSPTAARRRGGHDVCCRVATPSTARCCSKAPRRRRRAARPTNWFVIQPSPRCSPIRTRSLTPRQWTRYATAGRHRSRLRRPESELRTAPPETIR